MIKTYRFYYTLGIPVFDWPSGSVATGYKFRRTAKNVMAYSLTDAIERLSKPVVQKYGLQAKLQLEQAFVSTQCSPRISHAEDWAELSLEAATLAAFVVGAQARELLNIPA